MYKVFFIILLSTISVSAQELSETTYGSLFENTYSLGINFNTSGWGCSGEYTKKQNYKYHHTYSLSITNIRHNKEFKVPGISGARTYYYKKINSFIVLRPNYGGKYQLFQSKREQGIEIHLAWKIGPALGFLKPVYLDIGKHSSINTDPIAEKYNPEIHENSPIEGRSNWLKGVGEGEFQFGGSSKLGFNFNFADNESGISGGEFGMMLDFFPLKEVELMHGTKNFKFFSAFYLQFEIGSKL